MPLGIHAFFLESSETNYNMPQRIMNCDSGSSNSVTWWWNPINWAFGKSILDKCIKKKRLLADFPNFFRERDLTRTMRDWLIKCIKLEAADYPSCGLRNRNKSSTKQLLRTNPPYYKGLLFKYTPKTYGRKWTCTYRNRAMIHNTGNGWHTWYTFITWTLHSSMLSHWFKFIFYEAKFLNLLYNIICILDTLVSGLAANTAI